MKGLKNIATLFIGVILLSSCVLNERADEVKLGEKEGILLITFGSSYEAPQETFRNIEQVARRKFEGEKIHWSYTSQFIVKKLREGRGQGLLRGKNIAIDTPEEALEVMVKEGYSKFAIQSLHVIPGEEWDEMNEAIEAFETKHEGVHVTVGTPLLNTDADIAAVAKIMADQFKTQVAEGPVAFMGHGTPHAADATYLKLQAELQKININFFVGTVEGIGFEAGKTSIGGIVAQINAISPKPTKVTITPLMSIAGDHANNDMNGVTGETDPAEQSWRERLEAEGYVVTDVMKGLGDYAEVRAIWMKHLEAVK